MDSAGAGIWIAIPLLAGILPPVGLQWSLAAVSGIDLTAYNSVFQNQHSASLAHAIAGISAFTLAARFPGKRSLFYLALAMGCLALCVLTTARAGLLGMILGLILVAIFTRKLKLLAAPVALVFVALLVTAMVKPAPAAASRCRPAPCRAGPKANRCSSSSAWGARAPRTTTCA